MSIWLQVVLGVCGVAAALALIEITKKYWWVPREARVLATREKNIVRLDATAALGWLRKSPSNSLRNVVRGLLALEDARVQQLTRVESKVGVIIDNPYQEARNYLDSARRAGLGTDKGRKYLDKSIHDLKKAAANYSAVAPRRESWACLHLFLIYTALGNASRAQEWGARSYYAGVHWAQGEIRAFKNRRELRLLRWSVLALVAWFSILAGIVIVIVRGQFSADLWNDFKEASIASGVWYIGMFALVQAYGPDHYRQFVAWRVKAVMNDCDLFLSEMWKICSSLSSLPLGATSYRLLRIDDPEIDSGLDRKTYVLRSADPPGPAAPPAGPLAPPVQARQFGDESPSAVIDWDYYEASVQPYRLAIARSLFDRIVNTVEDRGLGWVPELRPTYFAFQQQDGYDRVGVDIHGSHIWSGISQVAKQPYQHSVDFWIKLPGSTQKLGHLTHHLLTHLYPALQGGWDAANSRWLWLVAELEVLPNVARAIGVAILDEPPSAPDG